MQCANRVAFARHCLAAPADSEHGGRWFGVVLPAGGASGPCFTRDGDELWVAEYDSRCIARVGWDAARRDFRVAARHQIPARLRSTAAAISLSPDASLLAVSPLVIPRHY